MINVRDLEEWYGINYQTSVGFRIVNVFDRLDLACAAVFCITSRFDGVDLIVTHTSVIW